MVSTRTGRRFFSDQALERALLERVCLAIDRSGIWTKLDTQWACLDCELLPWSAKAQELLRAQYAPVGAAGLAALPRAVAALSRAAARLEGADKDTALDSGAYGFRAVGDRRCRRREQRCRGYECHWGFRGPRRGGLGDRFGHRDPWGRWSRWGR